MHTVSGNNMRGRRHSRGSGCRARSTQPPAGPHCTAGPTRLQASEQPATAKLDTLSSSSCPLSPCTTGPAPGSAAGPAGRPAAAWAPPRLRGRVGGGGGQAGGGGHSWRCALRASLGATTPAGRRGGEDGGRCAAMHLDARPLCQQGHSLGVWQLQLGTWQAPPCTTPRHTGAAPQPPARQARGRPKRPPERPAAPPTCASRVGDEQRQRGDAGQQQLDAPGDVQHVVGKAQEEHEADGGQCRVVVHEPAGQAGGRMAACAASGGERDRGSIEADGGRRRVVVHQPAGRAGRGPAAWRRARRREGRETGAASKQMAAGAALQPTSPRGSSGGEQSGRKERKGSGPTSGERAWLHAARSSSASPMQAASPAPCMPARSPAPVHQAPKHTRSTHHASLTASVRCAPASTSAQRPARSACASDGTSK